MINPASSALAGFLQRAMFLMPEDEGVKKKGVSTVGSKGVKGKKTVYADGTVEGTIEDLLHLIVETENIDYSRDKERDPEAFYKKHFQGCSEDELDEILRKIKIISTHILHDKDLFDEFGTLRRAANASITNHRKLSKKHLDCYKKKIRDRLSDMEEDLEVEKSEKKKWLFSAWKKDKEEDRFAADYFNDIIDEYEYQFEHGNILRKGRPLKGRQFVVEEIKDILEDDA